MKIIVCGAGEVGANIAKQLVYEDNDVTIIDDSESRLRSLNKTLDLKSICGKIILPEFWNIRLELPRNPICKGGYDILYVDASRKGNFCSRTSHSCTPNLASSVAVVNGRYTIALRALRDIMPGEELTQDYNCVTDSLEEFKAAVCLCGFPRCRGAFLLVFEPSRQSG